ncbi:CLUMA_CG016166, isoform A [Clunio marinus]|uniref:CLUMA_CG016166, isoform A n=1 Tax=Clunio marinus TaxID=568069 RepID=A0A1J1IRZ6_9DIPT|nr:CLUMA_CG016166, isoform A [Clunio marinus]
MFHIKTLSYLILLVSIETIFGIVGGRHAAVPPYDDPVVFVNHVGRIARVEGYQNPSTGLYTFRGIKYADPPIRENRFMRPRMKRLSGDIDGRKNAPPCPQPDFYDENKIIGDEDCLALNIFTPQMPDESTGLPVLLWIHGGGYRYGSAAQFGAEPLVQNKVIFVPIQYRLGTLGILGDGRREFSGNVGMFDMYAALQWIKQYISFFGGDPQQIKVIGHGSGASSAMHLSSSPISRNSLNGVVSMSGSSLSQYSYDENAEISTEEIAKVHQCPHANEIELLKCLKKKSTEEIIKQDSKLQFERLMEKNMIKAMNGMLSFSPNIEPPDDQRGLPGVITDNPEDSLKKESHDKMPLLIGVTKHETANGIDVNEINRVFKSATGFLKESVATLKIRNLVNVPKHLAGLAGTLGLPTLEEYLTVPDGIHPEKLLGKLVETTTDVFFNVPSIMAADLWGKRSKAFFYQFEHVGDSESSGKLLLKPLPLVSKRQSPNMVAHGDDLGYLFDIHDVFGNRINATTIKSTRDIRARQNFIEMIVKFSYINSTLSEFKLNNQILIPFSTDASHFIKVSDKFSIDKDFRFCQLTMLGCPLKAIQKVSCHFLSEGLRIAKKIVSAPKKLLSKVKKLW